jgi:predicted transcriptional regulator
MEEDYERKLAWLQRAIDAGIADIERGDVIDGEQAVEEALLEYRQRIESARRSREMLGS